MQKILFLRVLHCETGLPVHAQWCFASGNDEHKDLITISGTEGSVEFSTFDFTPIRLNNAAGVSEYLPENPENIQYWFIKNMVEELRGDIPAQGNAESAVRTNWVMDKILGKIQP